MDVDHGPRYCGLWALGGWSGMGGWRVTFEWATLSRVIEPEERVAEVKVPADGVVLPGDLEVPETAEGLVLFAHGSGSSRHSPRNRAVAERLRAGGMATLLFDLLTESEAGDHALVFDIHLLGVRLAAAVDQATQWPDVAELPVGLFGASTGAAAALNAAVDRPGRVAAVVSRGGRPDLGRDLPNVDAPTLLIVGGADEQVLDLNARAAEQLTCDHALEVVPGAGHLFEGAGELEQVADLAADWFSRHLRAGPPTAPAT